MEYNVGKCEVKHFGRKNSSIDYFLNGERLLKSEAQRDLGVLVQDSLKVNVQVQLAVRKPHSMLASISRGLEYKSRDVLLRLHRALVRPHLEYCEQFCAPYLRKDVLVLEGVQRRFTRMISGMKGLSSKECLRSVGL